MIKLRPHKTNQTKSKFIHIEQKGNESLYKCSDETMDDNKLEKLTYD